MTDKTDRTHRRNMVPNAGWMGAAAILSERPDRMTLSFWWQELAGNLFSRTRVSS